MFLIFFQIFFKTKPAFFDFFRVFTSNVSPMPRLKSDFCYVFLALRVAEDISEAMSVFAEPKKIRAVFKVNRGAGTVVNVNAKPALVFAFACSGGITRGKSFGFCAGVTLFFIALNGGFKKAFLIIIAPVSRW